MPAAFMRTLHSISLLVALAVAIAVAPACAGNEAPAQVRFVPVTVAHTDHDLVIEASSAAVARARLLEDLDALPHAPAIHGRGAWRTMAVVRPGELPATAARARRTYALFGSSSLKLDVRVGAGKLGGFAGSVVSTGAMRAMVELRVEDHDAARARFLISVLVDDGPDGRPAQDVTPRYLARGVPGGTYRVSFDVGPRGARLLVGVAEETPEDGIVARAWASPVAIERPWR